jgi:ribose transport system ATP-binding protein
MSRTTLCLTAIEKRYPGVKSLDRVDFDVLEGEVHALVGENGAGKSTLSRIMNGATIPDGGTTAYLGEPVVWRSPRQARLAGIYTIHQELALFPELSVAENILIAGQPRGRFGLIDKRERLRRAGTVLAGLGANIAPQALVDELSVADQQMVEIAKALHSDAKLIIFDEPTASISGREVEALFRNIRSLRASGTSIVYISHRLEEIFAIADRITVLKDGKLVGTRKATEIDREGLIDMMIGRRLADIYPPRRRSAQGHHVVMTVDKLASGARVRDVTFSLRAGEILGLAGMVGSGRTELAHAIFGSAPIDFGVVTIEGKEVAAPSPKASIKLGIGFLTEDRKTQGLFPRLSVAQNIVAPALRDIARRGFLDGRVEKAIAVEQMRQYAIAAESHETRVLTLSGGNQQKLLFSRWSRVSNSVLILDEPTRGVDVGAKAEIYRIIRALAENGVGIMMISSELPELIGVADRVAVMSEGRIAGELSGSDITEEAIMRLAIVSTGGRAVDMTASGTRYAAP